MTGAASSNEDKPVALPLKRKVGRPRKIKVEPGATVTTAPTFHPQSPLKSGSVSKPGFNVGELAQDSIGSGLKVTRSAPKSSASPPEFKFPSRFEGTREVPTQSRSDPIRGAISRRRGRKKSSTTAKISAMKYKGIGGSIAEESHNDTLVIKLKRGRKPKNKDSGIGDSSKEPAPLQNSVNSYKAKVSKESLSDADDDLPLASRLPAPVTELLKARIRCLGIVDCPLCNAFRCESYVELLNHMASCKRIPITCDLCLTECVDLEDKVRHLKNEHNGIEYIINPDEISKYRSFLSRSMPSHKSFHCFRQHCTKFYTTGPGLNYHLKSCFPSLDSSRHIVSHTDGTAIAENFTALGSRASKLKARETLSSFLRDEISFPENLKEIKRERDDEDFTIDPETLRFISEQEAKDYAIPEAKSRDFSTVCPSPKKFYKRNHVSGYVGRTPYNTDVLPAWKPDLSKWRPCRLNSTIIDSVSPEFHIVGQAGDSYDHVTGEITFDQAIVPSTLLFGKVMHTHSGRSSTLYAGGRVTALSWAPYSNASGGLDQSNHDPEAPESSASPALVSRDSQRYYFCLCSHLNRDSSKGTLGTIQIWSMINPFAMRPKVCSMGTSSLDTADREKHSHLNFEYGIIHDFGLVYDAKFCPTYPQPTTTTHHYPVENFLGLLASTTRSGLVTIIPCPLPRDLLSRSNDFNNSDPGPVNQWFETSDVYYLSIHPPSKVVDGPNDPTAQTRVKNVPSFDPQCLDWYLGQGSCKLAAGYTDGTIAMWNLTACSQPSSPCFHTVDIPSRSETLSEISILSNPSCHDTTRSTAILCRPSRLIGPGIGHLRAITGLSFCPYDPTGRYLAAVSKDKAYAVWDMARASDYGCSTFQPLSLGHIKTANPFTGCVWPPGTVNVLAIGDTHASSSQSFHLFDNGYALYEPSKMSALHHSCHLAIDLDPYEDNYAIGTAGGYLVGYQDDVSHSRGSWKARAFRLIPLYQITSSVPLPDQVRDEKIASKSQISLHKPVIKSEADDKTFKIKVTRGLLYHKEINRMKTETGERVRGNEPSDVGYLLFNDIPLNVKNLASPALMYNFQDQLRTECFEHPAYKDALYIYKVAWNPFASAHNWLLSGTGSGFARLSYVPYLKETVDVYERETRRAKRKKTRTNAKNEK